MQQGNKSRNSETEEPRGRREPAPTRRKRRSHLSDPVSTDTGLSRAMALLEVAGSMLSRQRRERGMILVPLRLLPRFLERALTPSQSTRIEERMVSSSSGIGRLGPFLDEGALLAVDTVMATMMQSAVLTPSWAPGAAFRRVVCSWERFLVKLATRFWNWLEAVPADEGIEELELTSEVELVLVMSPFTVWY